MLREQTGAHGGASQQATRRPAVRSHGGRFGDAALHGVIAARREGTALAQGADAGRRAADRGQSRPFHRQGAGYSAAIAAYRGGEDGGTAHARRSPPRSAPAYITITRSQISATRSRLWLMNSMAMPSSSRSRASRSTTCACTVTSSAVVGSSAMSNFGWHATAIAIATRWRMPPLNSCGKAARRSRRIGDADQSASRSAARSQRGGRPDRLMRPDHVGQLPADGERRIERGQRVLEDHRDVAPAHHAMSRSAERQQRSALQAGPRRGSRCGCRAAAGA